MSRLDRRTFLKSSLAATACSATTASLFADPAAVRANDLHLAPFRFDVTPPKGHPLCGGWITPVVDVDDRLEVIGLVLLGAGKPIVLCAVDWTGLLNSAHVEWRRALAEAAGTTPDRVAVQCVHQHNAPFACLDAERIVQAYPELPHIVELDFYRRCLDQGRDAVSAALKTARPVTRIATGQAQVERVASNRRFVGAGGTIEKWRGSSCRDPLLQELPEGLIDPWLKTVAFYDGSTKIAACHYYATHPMSYYGDGRVSSDFVGLARKQRQQEEPNCTHLYFTGCAGNVAPGKYNDGSKEARLQLTRRMYDALVAADKTLKPESIDTIEWRTHEILPPPRDLFAQEAIAAQIADPKNAVVNRNRPAYTLAWLERSERKVPIMLSALHLDNTTLLHLPAESFLEYQLRAQQRAPDRFVATAAYGDGGPWYIPTNDAYPQGGYEVSVAFCDPAIDDLLTRGMESLLA